MAITKSAALLLLLVAAQCLTALPVADSETSTQGGEADPAAAGATAATGELADAGGDEAPSSAMPLADEGDDPAATAASGDPPVEDSTGEERAGATGEEDAAASSTAATGDSGTTAAVAEATSEVVVVQVAEDSPEDGADMEGAETMVFRPMFAYYPDAFQ